MTADALGPLFAVHSEPQEEKGWKAKRPTACSRLRELLSDGRWKHMSELQAVAGYRYGARAPELRRGADGGPKVTIEKRAIDGDSSNWEYRMVKP